MRLRPRGCIPMSFLALLTSGAGSSMRVALRRPGAMRAPLSIGMSAARRAEPTRDELGSMTVAQLKTELVRCGLPVSGTKGVLIDRLSGQRRVLFSRLDHGLFFSVVHHHVARVHQVVEGRRVSWV